jgi:hypothetical protein
MAKYESQNDFIEYYDVNITIERTYRIAANSPAAALENYDEGKFDPKIDLVKENVYSEVDNN